MVTLLNAYCIIDADLGVDSIVNDFRARNYFTTIASLSKIRMLAFYASLIISITIKKISKYFYRHV